MLEVHKFWFPITLFTEQAIVNHWIGAKLVEWRLDQAALNCHIPCFKVHSEKLDMIEKASFWMRPENQTSKYTQSRKFCNMNFQSDFEAVRGIGGVAVLIEQAKSPMGVEVPLY